MGLFIQHGHGKGTKIETALDEELVQGVIFSPRNEKPDRLELYIQELASGYDCELMLDPQMYVAAISPARVGYLEQYPYFTSNLSTSRFSMRFIQDLAQRLIDYQMNLGVTAIVAPTVIAESFNDRWYQIAVNLADASLDYHAGRIGAPPLLLSFAIAEQAYLDASAVDGFLDTLTQEGWETGGIYLLTPRRHSDYHQNWEVPQMANLLYAVHVLGELNGIRLILGYHDFCGLPFRAVGADAFASGWSQTLRQFLLKNFLVAQGRGGQPRARYSSGPLFNAIFMDELQAAFEAGMLVDVLSGVPHDEHIVNAPSPSQADWTKAKAQHHHLQTLQALDATIMGTTRQKLLRLLRQVREAQGTYAMLQQRGVRFEPNTGPGHLTAWASALAEFGRRINLG